MTTADFCQLWRSSLTDLEMTVLTLSLCQKLLHQLCTLSSKFTNFQSSTIPHQDLSFWSKWPAMKSLQGPKSTLMVRPLQQLLVQVPKTLLMCAENWKQQLMCAQNSKNTTLNIRTNLKENGNLLLMPYSQGLMPILKDAMIFSTWQLQSCSSTNFKESSSEEQKEKPWLKHWNKFLKSSKRLWKTLGNFLMIPWTSIENNLMMTLLSSDKKSKNSREDSLLLLPKDSTIMIQSWANSNCLTALKEFWTGQSSKMNLKRNTLWFWTCISRISKLFKKSFWKENNWLIKMMKDPQFTTTIHQSQEP